MYLYHASISENGTIHGKAGDQTGKEVCIRTWYDKGWNVMLRHPDKSLCEKAGVIAKKLCISNLVGYDQGDRNSLYKALKKHNFNVDKYIASKELTEADCSSFLYAIWCCLIPAMRSDSNAPTTSSMRKFYLKHGFKAYTDAKYLDSEKNLIEGDILIKEGHHVVGCTTTKTVPAEKPSVSYYPACKKGFTSIVDALVSVGVTDVSLAHRRKIAVKNGLVKTVNDTLTGTVNKKMRELLEKGKLIKA